MSRRWKQALAGLFLTITLAQGTDGCGSSDPCDYTDNPECSQW